jgi:hypothetical protein
MFLINNNNITDPTINLALEEYCLRNLDPDSDYFLFYINAPCIVVGKHQNIFQEVNWEYTQRNGIHQLAGEKYQSWDWTYGQSPEFIVRCPLGANSHKVNARIRVRHGLVKNIYAEDGEIADTIIRSLIGKPYNLNEIEYSE